MPQVPLLGMSADQKQKFKSGKPGEKGRAPGQRTLTPWRQVTAAGIQTGKTEPHGEDSNAGGIIKRLLINPHPLPQANTGRVGKGKPAGMSPDTGGLTRDTDTGRGRHLHYRPGFMIQRPAILRRVPTDPAPAHRRNEGIK